MKDVNPFSSLAIKVIIAAAMLFPWVIWSGNQANALSPVAGPSPPGEVVKLIFVHHSCGENWLADDHGGLGRALGDNNYYVSDTNYGWGPDSIGDRTDITDWPEWFRGQDSERYLEALYTESGQNSWYTRTLPDPGGENQIIMFKSCFPNSDLEGSLGDPPAAGDGLTVSNAKYIYNDLLNYFRTRMDKLFVVVTAPPLLDPTHAANARAFNTWLVQRWLSENGYTQNNVAVFDYHNLLTHPDNHHRYQGGGIEYTNTHGDGTLYYDSDGDEHPNASGNQKATAEFIPLLNHFYQSWKTGAPGSFPVEVPTPVETQPPSSGEIQPTGIAALAAGDGWIDGFESGPPIGSDGWVAYWDEVTETSMHCAPAAAPDGRMALGMSFDLPGDSWATCVLPYHEIRDWSAWEGVSLYVHASQPELYFDVHVYGGTPDEWDTYYASLDTTQAMVDGWVYMEFPWSMLLRAEWEDDQRNPIDPSRITAVGFGMGTSAGESLSGEIWIDDLRLLGEAPPEPGPTQTGVEAPVPTGEHPTAAPEQEQDDEGGGICPGSIALGMIVAASALWAGRRGLSI